MVDLGPHIDKIPRHQRFRYGARLEEALELRDAFDDKLASMGLRFSKASVLPASRGVNFLGYRIWPHKRLLRKDSVRRMKRAMRAMQREYAEGKISLAQVQERINSWVAHASHANSESLRRQILGSVVFSRGGKEAVR